MVNQRTARAARGTVQHQQLSSTGLICAHVPCPGMPSRCRSACRSSHHGSHASKHPKRHAPASPKFATRSTS